MQIKQVEDGQIMHQSIRCVNDSPTVIHYVPGFEQVGDNEYRCTNCGTILVLKQPVLVHDKDGRLKMQIHVSKKE